MQNNNLLADYSDVLIPEDIKNILHTGLNTVYSYLRNGTIRSLKIGGKYRIPKTYLIEFLNQDIVPRNKEG